MPPFRRRRGLTLNHFMSGRPTPDSEQIMLNTARQVLAVNHIAVEYGLTRTGRSQTGDGIGFRTQGANRLSRQERRKKVLEKSLKESDI